jgi:hypothetical protein
LVSGINGQGSWRCVGFEKVLVHWAVASEVQLAEGLPLVDRLDFYILETASCIDGGQLKGVLALHHAVHIAYERLLYKIHFFISI